MSSFNLYNGGIENWKFFEARKQDLTQKLPKKTSLQHFQ